MLSNDRRILWQNNECTGFLMIGEIKAFRLVSIGWSVGSNDYSAEDQIPITI
jgi:hypothetical protein